MQEWLSGYLYNNVEYLYCESREQDHPLTKEFPIIFGAIIRLVY